MIDGVLCRPVRDRKRPAMVRLGGGMDERGVREEARSVMASRTEDIDDSRMGIGAILLAGVARSGSSDCALEVWPSRVIYRAGECDNRADEAESGYQSQLGGRGTADYILDENNPAGWIN